MIGWLIAHLPGLYAALLALGFSPVRAFNWASKPAANALRAGTVIRVPDVGTGAGSFWVTDGADWRLAHPIVLQRITQQVAAPGDTNENATFSYTGPGGLLGTSRQLRFRGNFGVTNNANQKTFRARFGGMSGTSFLNSTATAITGNTYEVVIAASGSQSAQIGYGTAGANLNANLTSAVDTSQPWDFVFTVQKQVGTDAVNQRIAVLELWP